ncbi:MAG: N-acetylmuramoyl-L-alanine amidase [Chloroflexi bacterium]|nr:N-acetylmuramoyl-L-alanine amidase [Chloroflexota bacterium]
MNTNPTPRPSRKSLDRSQGAIYQFFLTLVVAFVLATLFTAWADPGALPDVLAERGAPPPQPQITNAPAPAVTPTPRSRPLIGLVAGHSGNDSGAVCDDGLTEMSVNKNIAVIAQRILVEQGYDVDLLEEFDPRLSGYQASLLVSIHADSCDYINEQATGFKVSAALANPYPDRALRLTACLRNRYAQATNLPLHNSVTIDMTSYHAFAEINPDTTAGIIEVGFLRLDRAKLTQEADLVAQGIVNGILCYMNNESITTP